MAITTSNSIRVNALRESLTFFFTDFSFGGNEPIVIGNRSRLSGVGVGRGGARTHGTGQTIMGMDMVAPGGSFDPLVVMSVGDALAGSTSPTPNGGPEG